MGLFCLCFVLRFPVSFFGTESTSARSLGKPCYRRCSGTVTNLRTRTSIGRQQTPGSTQTGGQVQSPPVVSPHEEETKHNYDDVCCMTDNTSFASGLQGERRQALRWHLPTLHCPPQLFSSEGEN